MYNEDRYIEVQYVWKHPLFKRTGLPHDIAVVELKSKLEWSVTTRPACLPTADLVHEYEGPLMVSVQKAF